MKKLKGGTIWMASMAYDQPMSRTELAEFAPKFLLPYTSDSMRGALRALGLTPLFYEGEAGTKTTRVAQYDAVVLWALTLSLHSPKPWRPKSISPASVEPGASLASLLAEYERRAQSMAFMEFSTGDAKHPERTWKRVACWRLLVDRERGLELRLLDRIVSEFPQSLQFGIDGPSVLPDLLQRYKTAMIRYLGSDLGGSGEWFESWDLVDEVLESAGVTMPQIEQAETASQRVVNRLDGRQS